MASRTNAPCRPYSIVPRVVNPGSFVIIAAIKIDFNCFMEPQELRAWYCQLGTTLRYRGCVEYANREHGQWKFKFDRWHEVIELLRKRLVSRW